MSSSLLEAGIQDGDVVIAVAKDAQLAATCRSLALCVGGTVVTWDATTSGNQSQVQKIQAAGDAFAAIKDNGKVVIWGDPRYSEVWR